MNKNIELDTKILNKNLEITKLTKQIDDLTSDNVNLLKLLNEIHERMYSMMEYCERLQPVRLDMDETLSLYNEDWKVGTINVTNEEDMIKTKLFRLIDKDDMTNYDDQTSRSILKDLRKVIKSLEK